jgi:hypothetical protein
MADRSVAGQRPDSGPGRVDDHVELVGEGDAVLGATPSASELPPPLAIAAVTTLGYLGSFTGPPLVGAIAELTGLSAALALLVAAALVPVVLARRALNPRPAGGHQPSLR